MNEIRRKTAEMGQGAGKNQKLSYLYHLAGPPAGNFPQPAEWPAEGKVRVKGVERKSSQGMHAEGHKLCCWETAIPDTPTTRLKPYRQAKSPGPPTPPFPRVRVRALESGLPAPPSLGPGHLAVSPK